MHDVKISGLKYRWLLWAGGLFLICLLCPLRYQVVKIVLIGSGIVLWLGLSARLPRRWRVIALVPFLLLSLHTMPGRNVDTPSLRTDYVAALRSFRGTFYVWGGGNHLGIDCSGLVRMGLAEAAWNAGIKSGNPRLWREAVSLWWHNCSARALGEGYRDESFCLAMVPSLNALEADRLLPGDFAVTEDGTHTLVYLGDRRWIEAEPREQHVVEKQLPDADIYFNEPMRLMRWRLLDDRGRTF